MNSVSKTVYMDLRTPLNVGKPVSLYRFGTYYVVDSSEGSRT
jgi:hypothetical protein